MLRSAVRFRSGVALAIVVPRFGELLMMVTKEIQELQSGTFRAFDGLKLFPDTRLENRNRNEQHRHADNDEHDVHVDFANAAADADANRTHAIWIVQSAAVETSGQHRNEEGEHGERGKQSSKVEEQSRARR